MPTPTQTPDQENLDPSKDVGQEDFDEIIAKNFTPEEQRAMEERASSGLANKESQAAGGPVSSGDESEESDETSSADEVEKKEERGDTAWQDNTSSDEEPEVSPFRLTKKRSAGLGLIVGIVGIGTMYSFIFGPALGIVNLKEIMMDKFDNRMTALSEKRNIRLMSKKMSKQFTTGCTIKVKCRFKGMTEREIKKFETRTPGTKIKTGTCIGVGSIKKCSIKSITFLDEDTKMKTVEARNFKKVLKGSPILRDTVRNYNKPNVAHWRDVAASKWANDFKIDRGKIKPAVDDPEHAGKSPEEKQKIRIRETMRETVSGARFDALQANKTNAPDDNGDGTSDSQTEDDIREDVSDNINEEADKIASDMEDSTKAIDNPPSIGGEAIDAAGKVAAAGTLGAVRGAVLGPLNAADRACAAKRLIATVGYAAKALNAAALIRYSMRFIATADQIKAGDADGDSAQAIGDLGSILSSKDPDTGLSGSDSFGYQYAAYGSLIKEKDSNQVDTAQIFKYSLGAGMTGTLLAVTNKINSVPGFKKGCKFIGNPMVQIGGAVLGLAAAFFTGGGSALASAAVGATAGVGLAVATQIATPILARSIAGAIISGDEFGMDAVNAITSGFGSATSMLSRYRGAFPLSITKAIVYDQHADGVKKSIARDQGLSGYLDPSNPRSLGGRLATAITPTLNNFSFATAPSQLASLSLGSISKTSRAYAAEDGEQYKICNDEDYLKMNVAAGPFCDVQYGFDPKTIDVEEGTTYDADNVLAYMCGSSVDTDVACGEDNYIDNEGNAQGDYSDWLEECVNTDKPLSSDGEDETPKECFDPATTDDPTKYTMFSIYTFDSTFDDQYEDRDGNQESADATDDSLIEGESKELAQQLLDNPNVTYPYEDTKGVTAREVLEEVAKTGKGIVNSSDVSITRVAVSANMLKALVEYAEDHKIGLNPITNADHSATSNHYKGIAVDLDCNPTLDRAAFEAIAKKYGGKNNGEVCPGDSHWHYDFPKD